MSSRIYGWEILVVSYHSDKLGDNRPCDKLDFMFLTYHVALHNHLFKWKCGFMIGSPHLRRHSANFVDFSYCGRGHKTFPICHVTL